MAEGDEKMVGSEGEVWGVLLLQARADDRHYVVWVCVGHCLHGLSF
jgi:hypothetical protein